MSIQFKSLLAAAAVTLAGVAVAQGTPPNPSVADPAVGAGQQSTQGTSMGTTGTPAGDGTATMGASGSTGTTSSSGSTMTPSTSGSTAATGSGTMSSGTTAAGSSTTTTDMSGSTASNTTRPMRADRN